MSTTYDYVIVGAGSAGCVLANRLSADPSCRVLLLEAGPPDRNMQIRVPAAWLKLFKSEVDWALQTEPEEALHGRRIFIPRGKTLGGSSSINAQMYIRGHRVDFDGWAHAGNAGWAYDDVLPYFRRCERNERGANRYHGASGELHVSDIVEPNPLTRAFLDAAVQAGLAPNSDFNGAQQDGVGITQVTHHRGRRWSTADAFLRPARRRRNLTVVTGALAERVLFEGARASGVAYRLAGTSIRATARREIILSAGAYGSPHLLQLSGVGPAEQIAAHGIEVLHHLPGVGQNLQDHFVAPAALVTTDRPWSLYSAESPRHLLRWLLFRRGMLTSNGPEAVAFHRTVATLDAPDLELIFVPMLFIGQGLEPPPRHGFSIAAVPLRPRSRGHVVLRSSDPTVPPAIRSRYLTDPDGEDLRVVLAGVRLARRIVAQPALQGIAGDEMLPVLAAPTDDEIASTIREHGHTCYHPVGTCRMGNDAMAVVSPTLEVRGLRGLRVVDASVMPTLIGGHTNAATIMIAERAADLILGRARLHAHGMVV